MADTPGYPATLRLTVCCPARVALAAGWLPASERALALERVRAPAAVGQSPERERSAASKRDRAPGAGGGCRAHRFGGLAGAPLAGALRGAVAGAAALRRGFVAGAAALRRGFVAGAVASAGLNLSDRFSARLLLAGSVVNQLGRIPQDADLTLAVAVRNRAAAKQRLDKAMATLGKESTPEDVAEALQDYHRRKQAVNDSWQRLAEASPGSAADCLERIPGISVWTSASTLAVAHGDPDQVPVGDFHIKHIVVHHLTGRDRDLWLVVHRDLLAVPGLEGVPEVDEQPEPLQPRIGLPGVHGDRVATLLGLIHGDVGVAHEVCELVPVVAVPRRVPPQRADLQDRRPHVAAPAQQAPSAPVEKQVTVFGQKMHYLEAGASGPADSGTGTSPLTTALTVARGSPPAS